MRPLAEQTLQGIPTQTLPFELQRPHGVMLVSVSAGARAWCFLAAAHGATAGATARSWEEHASVLKLKEGKMVENILV
jgi:hypothetical protein